MSLSGAGSFHVRLFAIRNLSWRVFTSVSISVSTSVSTYGLRRLIAGNSRSMLVKHKAARISSLRCFLCFLPRFRQRTQLVTSTRQEEPQYQPVWKSGITKSIGRWPLALSERESMSYRVVIPELPAQFHDHVSLQKVVRAKPRAAHRSQRLYGACPGCCGRGRS